MYMGGLRWSKHVSCQLPLVAPARLTHAAGHMAHEGILLAVRGDTSRAGSLFGGGNSCAKMEVTFMGPECVPYVHLETYENLLTRSPPLHQRTHLRLPAVCLLQSGRKSFPRSRKSFSCGSTCCRTVCSTTAAALAARAPEAGAVRRLVRRWSAWARPMMRSGRRKRSPGDERTEKTAIGWVSRVSQ